MCEGRNLWKIPAPAVGILLVESSDTVPREDGHPYHTLSNVHGIPKHDKTAVVVPIKYGVVGHATMCVCVLSCVCYFATSGTVAPLSMDLSQTRILEWVTISSFRESSPTGN